MGRLANEQCRKSQCKKSQNIQNKPLTPQESIHNINILGTGNIRNEE